jgi:hypothetical protein
MKTGADMGIRTPVSTADEQPPPAGLLAAWGEALAFGSAGQHHGALAVADRAVLIVNTS